MPVISNFKKCEHGQRDWRECHQCIDEVATSLMLARTYLNEIANAEFNDNGDCVTPVTEPIRGQNFQRIAATALGVIS